MQLRFGNADLARCFGDSSHAKQSWGSDAAARYLYVVNFLACVDSIEDLAKFRFLQARPREAGQSDEWTIDLTSTWELRFITEGNPQRIVVTNVKHHD